MTDRPSSPPRRGRPRGLEPRVVVAASMPASSADRVIKAATAERVSVSAYVKRVLAANFGKQK